MSRKPYRKYAVKWAEDESFVFFSFPDKKQRDAWVAEGPSEREAAGFREVIEAKEPKAWYQLKRAMALGSVVEIGLDGNEVMADAVRPLVIEDVFEPREIEDEDEPF